MMNFIIFTLSLILLNDVKCNETVLFDNKTQMGSLFDTIELSCPMFKNGINISLIIWKFDNISLPISVDSYSNENIMRIRGMQNGSLLITKVLYSDAKEYTCKGHGQSKVYEFIINLIVKGPPNNFTYFSYEAILDSRLKFFWDINITENNAVEMYNLTLCKKLITKDCDIVSILHPQYTYEFQNLIPFSQYEASIIAFNKIGRNKRSDINAKTGPGTPVARAFISLLKVNKRNVTLNISCQDCLNEEKMKGLFKYFVINYRNRELSLIRLEWSSNTSMIENVIINLYPYTNYSFNVSASNGVNTGPVDSVTCFTEEDLPESTSYLYCSHVRANDMVVRWQAASDRNGPIIGYILTVDKDDKELIRKEFDHTIYHYNLTGLKPRSSYLLGLAARNNAGISNFHKIRVPTDRSAPLPPKNIKVTFIGEFIKISFTNPLNFNESSGLKYDICWNTSKFINKCVTAFSQGDHFIKCMCQSDKTTHSVELIASFFNVSKLFLTVTVKVPSELGYRNRYLEATSEKYLLNENDFPNKGNFSLTNILILLLTFGCILFCAGFFLISCFWGNKNFKEIFVPNRSNGIYLRPPGELMEIYPRSLSQPKIIPLSKTPYPAILVKDLVDHIMNYRCDDGAGFQTEFEAIESMDSSRYSITYPNLKENKIKNRYTNIFPYDHSRVIIQNPANGKSDYINASFVDGYNRNNAYIATQGPLTETIGEFWQMVYEQNSEIIVMISNFEERGRCKCEVYWVPNKVVSYGNISVRQIYHKKMAFYTERRFSIKNIRHKKSSTNKERTVYHYQYTDWRDFDVPPSSLPVLVFVKATTKHWSCAHSGPIIVHCSAGVGRTGTYMCIESQIRQMEAEHSVNVRGFLEHIRQQRMKLVQTESQYTFIYDALYEYYLCPDHEIHKDILLSYIFQLKAPSQAGFSKLEQQFQMCTQFEPTNYEYLECKRSYNVTKNSSEIWPIESRRINISLEPGIDGSNYINASAIQGYWAMKEFIITQHPTQETEPDFWKMVWDENCTTIILLSSESLLQFWPENENEFRSYRWSRVNFCNSEDSGHNISKHGFLLSSPREDYALDCVMYRLKQWPMDVSETADLLRLLFKVNSDMCHSPIVVIDDFGGFKAGIFVAMSSLLNQLRNDDVVDVYFIMKMIHAERPHTFSSSDDLRFLYDLLGHIVTNHSLYPFFTEPPPTFTANGGASHPPTPSNVKKSSAHAHNNNDSLLRGHYAVSNSLCSKSCSTSRRRALSAAESDTNSADDKCQGPRSRISWNPGETRHYDDTVITEYAALSSLVGNGHFDNVATVSVIYDIGTLQPESEPL